MEGAEIFVELSWIWKNITETVPQRRKIKDLPLGTTQMLAYLYNSLDDGFSDLLSDSNQLARIISLLTESQTISV